jgi:acyl carrier protein
MSENTAERVIKIVAEYKEIAETGIKKETTLDELEIDSLDALNLVFELEEEFDIEIPDEKAFEMKTIDEMIKGIDKLRNLNGSGGTVEAAGAAESAPEG